MSEKPVVIVGAGVAGLTCARELQREGVNCLVLEASDDGGGRVRTDVRDGFRLDRGFQVLLTAYPEVRAALDLSALKVRAFRPGALIWTGESWRRLSDPLRQPTRMFETLLAPIGNWSDKLNILKLRRAACAGSLDQLFERPEQTTAQALQEYGFTPRFVDQFLRPFLGGIFLEKELQTSSRMLHFVFRMFAQGEAVLPALGMGEIPRQLAHDLPPGTVHCHTPVREVLADGVLLESGERIDCDWTVIATPASAVPRLLPQFPQETIETSGPSVTCLYFAAAEPPIREPILLLNGSGRGLINNACVPSQVSADYAPPGASLISVTVLETPELSAEQLVDQVRQELREMFGEAAATWRHLKTYQIPQALPNQSHLPRSLNLPASQYPRVLICGDHTLHGSLQGAMQSGRQAASQILSQLLAPSENQATRPATIQSDAKPGCCHWAGKVKAGS